MKFAVIVTLLVTLSSCCSPAKKYRHTSIVEVTFTDGTIDKLTTTYLTKASKVEIQIDPESACAIMRGNNGTFKVIACDVRKYKVISNSGREIKTK